MNRREAMGITGAGMIAMLAAPTATEAQAIGDVERLIKEHQAAIDTTNAAWKRQSEIYEAHAPWPDAKVQYSTLREGDVVTPLYAYSIEHLNEVFALRREQLKLFYPTALPPKLEESLTKQYEVLCSDLQTYDEIYRRKEQASGLEEADDHATACGRIADEKHDLLVTYPCKTLAEAKAVAAHLYKAFQRGGDGVDNESLVSFIATLGGLGGDA